MITIALMYLILSQGKIYSNEVLDKVLLCLCFVFKIIVCKDDDFSALRATKSINENIEKCTMMLQNGIELFQQSTVLFWFQDEWDWNSLI